jgi:glycosyltransferase involved in cell wall biosynthesis
MNGFAGLRIAMTSLHLPGSSKIGVGYQVHHLANELVGRGHTVTVFSADPPGDGACYTACQVDPGRSLRTFRFAWRLRDIDFAEFDILHAHGDDCFLGLTRRPPHVRTVHGSCFAEAHRIHGLENRARMTLLGVGELASMTIANRIVAVSRTTTRTYPWIRQVIPCGVDVNRFGAASGMSREPDPTILFVGTYGFRKRGRLLMEAFAHTVRPALPQARLWMVCDDAPQAPGVEVLGRISDAELVERYQRSWLFCLPSSYEGFGVPYIEALASGCPVVATPNAGALEVLEGGRWGSLVDDDRVGDAIVALLADDARRAEMAARGRERAKQFDWPEVADAYERIYASLI